MELGKQIKELENMQKEIGNHIKTFMGNAEKGDSNSYRVSWASAQRSTFDNKKFAEDHSNMDLSKYYKQSSYRTFKVSEIKN